MYKPSLLKPYLKTKYDNNIEVKNKELYLLCNCEIDDQKSSVRALKSKYLKEFRNASNGETNGVTNDLGFIKTPISSHSNKNRKGIKENHILDMIKKYPELPLFIYSKIFERIRPEYDRLNKERKEEYKSTKKVVNDYYLNYSFYDLYMEIFNDINQGKLDQEIEEYMKDVIQSFGNTHVFELEGCEFIRSTSEEDDYMCNDDYNWFLRWVLEIISQIVDYFIEPLTFKELRYEILKYLLIKSSGDTTALVSSILDMLPKDLIRIEILKLYILGRKIYPNMESVDELYDEFDKRYSDKLDYKERGINYRGQWDDEFYKDKGGEFEYKTTLEEALLWEKEGFEGLGERGILNLEYMTEKHAEGFKNHYKRILENRPDDF